MKYLISKVALFFSGMLTLVVVVQAQIPVDIVESIQNGNDLKLASFFNENIEMEVLARKDVYSKAQGRQIVAEFFKANKPKQFNMIHQDKNETFWYAVGSLKTNTGFFRVYLVLKIRDNKPYIHQLKIWK
jgi:hypothetical protein